MRLLYIDIDTLRADHLSCYGYRRETSPNIDRIAREGVRFDNYYCSDAPCQPSRTAMMTGRFGIHTGLVGHGGTSAEVRIEGSPRGFKDKLAFDSVPAFLRSVGLKTVSVSPFAERHSSWSFYAGFSEMHNPGRSGMESAEEVTPLALDWIERNAEKNNWFLHVNYWDPHTPYRAPEEFGNPFVDDPPPTWVTEEILEEHRRMVGPHTAQELSMYTNQEKPRYPRQPGEIKDMTDLKRQLDGYDCGVAHADKHTGILLEALEKKGVLDDLAIVVSSDHAENQGELGIYGEHATADHGTCRIPFIIKWPGCEAGRVDAGLHYNLDLGPTLAELFGKDPCARWDGTSYARSVTEGADTGREYLVVSQCAHVCQRGVRFGDWMYVRSYHDGYHLFPKEMLFNLKDDPYEQKDLMASDRLAAGEAGPLGRPHSRSGGSHASASEHGEAEDSFRGRAAVSVADEARDICRQAVYYLNEWHDDMMATMPCDTDPLWTVMREGGPAHARGQLAKYCERLEKTGRGYAVEELKKRHPYEFA